MPDTPTLIAAADRVADRVTDVLNAERDAMDAAGQIEPFALLAGVCLALLGLLRTAPPSAEHFALLRALKQAASAWCAFFAAYVERR